MILLTHDAKLIRKLIVLEEFKKDVCIVSASKEQLDCSDCIFILLSDNTVKCFNTNTLM